VQSIERNQTSRFLVHDFERSLFFLIQLLFHTKIFARSNFFHLDNPDPNPVERKTISNPNQIQKIPNILPDWLQNPDPVHHWSGWYQVLFCDTDLLEWIFSQSFHYKWHILSQCIVLNAVLVCRLALLCV